MSLSLCVCVYTFQLILVYSDYYCIHFKVKSTVQFFLQIHFRVILLYSFG